MIAMVEIPLPNLLPSALAWRGGGTSPLLCKEYGEAPALASYEKRVDVSVPFIGLITSNY